MVDFDTKCASLHLSYFISSRDDFASRLWLFLDRYLLGYKLANFNRRFNFCSNLVHSSLERSRFYKVCLTSFSRSHATCSLGSLPDDLSCQKICTISY